jgi:two-component system response regulator BaeR
MNQRILVVEDEKDLGEILRDYLLSDNFDVTLIADGKVAQEYLQNEHWDLVILDLMLPNIDGLTLCKEIRKTSSLPVVITTAKVEEIDRLLGLEIGADDYICKPYSPREVIARVKAVLRRAQLTLAPEEDYLQLNKDTLEARLKQQVISLTSIEFRLLETLANNKHKVVSREQLLKNAYDDHRVVSDRTMDSHITKLRKKLSSIYDGDPIQSVYGVGYRLQIAK